MDTIERVKHDGAVSALMNRIDSLRFELTNRNWEAIRSDGAFCRLGEAMGDADTILMQMREALSALQELEPDNL
jgi:hypothetical protein